MKLSMKSVTSTNSMPESLLQTVGIMKHTLRSVRHVEKRLRETMEATDVDPRLRSEMQHLFEATSEVRSRLSLMSLTVAEVLKEAVTGQASDSDAFGESERRHGQTKRAHNRLHVVRGLVGQS